MNAVFYDIFQQKDIKQTVKTFPINNTVLRKLVGWKTYWDKASLKVSCDKPHQDLFRCKMKHIHQPITSMNFSETTSPQTTALVVVESCILVLLNVATLVGNSLVCLAFYRNPSLRTATNYFVLSLALTDLSMAVLVMPSSAMLTTTGNGIGNELSCLISYFCAGDLAGISLLTVALLAVNRYFRVVRPALYPSIFSKKRSAAMAVCVWVVTIAMITAIGFVTSKQPQKVTIIKSVVSCIQFVQQTSSSKVPFDISIINIAVPSITVMTCYIKIFQTIRQHNTASAPSSQGGHSSYGVEEAKITRMLTVVMVGFYLCWLPPLISYISPALGLFGETAIKYCNFYHTFPFYASSATNPMAYATMSHSFRNEFLKIFRFEPLF